MDKIIFRKIPSGTFTMGDDSDEGHPLDKEYPLVDVFVKEFEISETTITNFQFKQFIDETGYITTAEKYGGSMVFHTLINEDLEKNSLHPGNTPWWVYVENANWKNPFGPNSTIENIMEHPVVHVSYFDALAFCEWSNTRLPSEAEWEYAARAGSPHKWPWGSDFILDGKYMANIWQGDFPNHNTKKDGFFATAPAKYYFPNKFGLYNVIGNVWEWCINPRGIDLSVFNKNDFIIFPPFNLKNINEDMQFAQKGGSFLCHPNYCNRYRLGARNGNSANSTTSNCGFRVCK